MLKSGKYNILFDIKLMLIAIILLSILILIITGYNLRKIFKINISYKLEFIYIVFIFFAQFLGLILDLYNIVWWFDLFVHFLYGILCSILSLLLLFVNCCEL